MVTETDYKRQLRKVIGGWSEAYETRAGSGVGYPDLQFLVRRSLLGVLVPVEVKVGEVSRERLVSREIRPSQISWWHSFMEAGGYGFVFVCSGPVAAMDAWATPSLDRLTLSRWKEGWEIQKCKKMISAGLLIRSL
jgi:hypothetical protein